MKGKAATTGGGDGARGSRGACAEDAYARLETAAPPSGVLQSARPLLTSFESEGLKRARLDLDLRRHVDNVALEHRRLDLAEMEMKSRLSPGVPETADAPVSYVTPGPAASPPPSSIFRCSSSGPYGCQ